MKKWIAKLFLFILGWKVDPVFPPEAQRSVMLAAPHTTNWDFFYVILAFWYLEIPMKVAIKDDWTKFPFGLFVKPLGGLGINRSPKVPGKKRPSQVDQMAAFFTKMDRIALVIAPEGTRKLRNRWKLGFYHVATQAGVPITFGYLDYEKKRAGVGALVLYPTGDIDADLPVVMDFYKDIIGKHPENFMLDERYVS